MEPKVIFEDEDLLVLDKPSGMIVNRSDTTRREKTAQEWVESKFRIQNSRLAARLAPKRAKRAEFRIDEETDFYKRAGIVHRLDKETSGILLVVKNLEAFVNLQAQFKERKVQKTYVALAHGEVEPIDGEIDVAVGRLPWNRKRFGVLSGGRESVTQYKVLRNVILRPHAEGSHEILRYAQNDIKNENLTLVELYPKSGRTHQIRVHLQYVKHPIFSDPLYAGRKTSRNDRKILPRIFLHAAKISFFHPTRNEIVSFESLLPEDLSKFLSSLGS